jgi:membrane protein implicated in regulation of membrane protease activity
VFPFAPSRRRATRKLRRADLRAFKDDLAAQEQSLRHATDDLATAATAMGDAHHQYVTAKEARSPRALILAAIAVPLAMIAAGQVLFLLVHPALWSADVYWLVTGPTYVLAAVTSSIIACVAIVVTVRHRREVHRRQAWRTAAETTYDALQDTVTDLERNVEATRSAILDRKRR